MGPTDVSVQCTVPRLEFILKFRGGRARFRRGRYLGGDASTVSNPVRKIVPHYLLTFPTCHQVDAEITPHREFMALVIPDIGGESGQRN